MKAFRLNVRAARDAPLSPMDALAAMLSSPPPPSITAPTAPSPQVAAGEPEYAGAEDTCGVLRAGGNGGVATAAATAASEDTGAAMGTDAGTGAGADSNSDDDGNYDDDNDDSEEHAARAAARQFANTRQGRVCRQLAGAA